MEGSKLRELLKSVDRRLVSAVAVAGVGVLLALGAAFATLNDQARQLVARQIEREVTRDLNLFETIHSLRGSERLARAVPQMTAPDEDPRFAIYLDAEGRKLAGNLSNWPPAVPGSTAFMTVELDGKQLHVAARTLRDGSRLLVGEQVGPFPLGTRPMMLAAFVALGFTLFDGIAVGVQFNRYILDRVDVLSDTARQIMRGQVEARLPEGRRLGPFGRLSRTLNEMLEQNEAVVSGLRSVTDSLAHDLRTPLMRMRSEVQAARAAGDAAERDARLARAETEAEYTLLTFTALIDIARAESGVSRAGMEPTDLAGLARDVAELFEPVAAEAGVRMVARIQPAHARAHRQLLLQALTNLIENAIRHAPPGTEVLFALEPGSGERGPRFTVADHGPGIPEESRDRVQRRFETLGRPGDPRGGPGPGLGLAIAAAAARLHGGRMTLSDAAPGLRVTFEIEPQRADASAPHAGRDEAAGASRCPVKRALAAGARR
jgi:hypothetical protein